MSAADEFPWPGNARAFEQWRTMCNELDSLRALLADTPARQAVIDAACAWVGIRNDLDKDVYEAVAAADAVVAAVAAYRAGVAEPPTDPPPSATVDVHITAPDGRKVIYEVRRDTPPVGVPQWFCPHVPTCPMMAGGRRACAPCDPAAEGCQNGGWCSDPSCPEHATSTEATT